MNELEKEKAENKEFNDLDRYRQILKGATVKEVHFTADSDEGLVITFDNGAILYFAFSGYEGTIKVTEK